MALDESFFQIKSKRRGFDPRMIEALRGRIGAAGNSIQTGMFNQGQRQLTQGGLGRSARKFALPAAAANARSKFEGNALLDLNRQDAQFAEGNRRFDHQEAFRLKELFLQEDAKRRKRKFNPLKAGIDIAKFAVPLAMGGPAGLAVAGAASGAAGSSSGSGFANVNNFGFR